MTAWRARCRRAPHRRDPDGCSSSTTRPCTLGDIAVLAGVSRHCQFRVTPTCAEAGWAIGEWYERTPDLLGGTLLASSTSTWRPIVRARAYGESMAESITPQQFHEADGVDDWRVLWSVAFAVFRTGDFATGVTLGRGDRTTR